MIIDEEKLKDFIIDVIKEQLMDLLDINFETKQLGGNQLQVKVVLEIKDVGSISDYITIKS